MSVPPLIAVLVVLAACAAPEPSHPNILLVSIDSLRADHVGANGYERDTTPHLDALGAAGAVFRTAISPSSWTLPTHVTLLTSVPPQAHGVGGVRNRLAPEVVTLAEVLRDAGYETAGFVGGPLLRRIYGHDQGFDVYDESAVAGSPTPGSANRGITSPPLVGLVQQWLAGWSERDAGRPFFVFLHLWDVHYDYAPPAPYDRLFDPDYQGDLDASDYERNPALKHEPSARDLQHLIALYDGEIRFTDEWIGRLLGTLEGMGLADDTIVVVTADHGDEFFEHGRKGHAMTLFDEVVRIPLLIRYPRRIAPGQVVDEQVRLQDVAPTILGLAGVAPPASFGVPHHGPEGGAGMDLAPWLVGRTPRPYPALPAYGLLQVFVTRASLRTRTHKLIAGGGTDHRDAWVFDLRTDGGEQKPLVPRHGTGRYLRRMLTHWTRYWSHQRQPPSLPLEIDAAQQEQLRALGYLE